MKVENKPPLTTAKKENKKITRKRSQPRI